MQGGHVALQTAIGLYGDESTLCTQTLALGRDDVHMLRVDLRHDHRHIRGHAVGGVVGHHGTLRFGVGLLQRLDLVLFHVDRTEHKIYLRGNLLHVGGIQHDHLFDGLRHGTAHHPVAAHGLLVGFTGAAGTGRQRCHMEPRVIFQQRNKPLTDHTGGSHHTNFELFHPEIPSFPIPSYLKYADLPETIAKQ